MTHEMMIAILEEDKCTRSEAEKKYLKTGTAIFESPYEYIEMLKANDCYDGETVEDIIKMPDTSLVTYEGHEYVIMYCL